MHYYLPNAVDLPGVYLPKQRKQELTGNGMRLTDDAGESTEQETSEVGTSLIEPLKMIGAILCSLLYGDG